MFVPFSPMIASYSLSAESNNTVKVLKNSSVFCDSAEALVRLNVCLEDNKFLLLLASRRMRKGLRGVSTV